MKLKIMTYNICSGHDHNDYTPENPNHGALTVDATRAGYVMKKHMPDIIGVNEVRGKGNIPEYAEQARQMGEVLGYHYFFGPAIQFENGPYGNAILSRFPILHAEVIPIPDPEVKDEDAYYETRDIIKAELDVPGGMTVFVSHFGLAKSEEKNAVATLLDALKDVKGNVLFMGDLNMRPDNPILAPVFDVLNDTASIQAEPPMTFAWYNPDRKIDYIFTSKNIRTLDIEVPFEKTSDHMPYVANIEF